MNQERLKSLLHYDPIIGRWTWRITRGRLAPAGSNAGFRDKSGYVVIRVDRKLYRAHRLAWLYVTGKWPKDQIDHINGDRSDNRFRNLREATGFQNRANSRKRKDNTSGYKGVHWRQDANKWRARIHSNGKCVYLGYFSSKEGAHAAYISASKIYHGKFANSGEET